MDKKHLTKIVLKKQKQMGISLSDTGVIKTEKYNGVDIKITALKPNGMVIHYKWSSDHDDMPIDNNLYPSMSEALAVARHQADKIKK